MPPPTNLPSLLLQQKKQTNTHNLFGVCLFSFVFEAGFSHVDRLSVSAFLNCWDYRLAPSYLIGHILLKVFASILCIYQTSIIFFK